MRVSLRVCEKEHMWVQANPKAKIYTHYEKGSVFFFYSEMNLCVFTCVHVCVSVCYLFTCMYVPVYECMHV